jgi:hypothetical protein
MKTVSDRREEKAEMTGERKAWVRDQKEIKFQAARLDYLQSNPDVGTINRNGKEIFYRNILPLHLGLIEEFLPSSVIHA